MTRDMSEKQFQDALARNGMKEGMGFWGYVQVGIPGHEMHVSRYNAGKKRRNQLAYLLAERDRYMQLCKCGHMRIDHCFKHPNPEVKHKMTWGCWQQQCRETCLTFTLAS